MAEKGLKEKPGGRRKWEKREKERKRGCVWAGLMFQQEQAVRETEAVFGPLRERIGNARERLEGLLVCPSIHPSSLLLFFFLFFFSSFSRGFLFFFLIRLGEEGGKEEMKVGSGELYTLRSIYTAVCMCEQEQS